MRRHRLTRPVRADLTRRLVADGEHEMERWCAWLGEFSPVLRPEVGSGIVQPPKQFDGIGVDGPRGVAAGAVCLESPLPEALHDGLGHDAASRVAGADKQNAI